MNDSHKIFLLLAVLTGLVAGVLADRYLLGRIESTADAGMDIEHARKHLDPTYVCPMHPEIVSKEAGSTCPICGMDLVPVKEQHEATGSDTEGLPVVSVTPSVMNSLGVRTAPVERKTIVRRVEIPGFVQQIKKGRQTRYTARVKSTLTEVLFKQGVWYESGAPLVVLESDQLRQAQERHLAILERSEAEQTVSEEMPGKISEDTVTDPGEDELGQAENGENIEDGEDETDTPSVISPEQRARLYAMGLNDMAIDEMEREMVKDMVASKAGGDDAGSESETRELPEAFRAAAGLQASSDPVVPEQETGVKETGKQVSAEEETGNKASAADEDTEMSLDDSRRDLNRLGMRAEDIYALETSRTASNRLVIYAAAAGKVMDNKVSEGDTLEAGTFMFRLGGQVRAVVLANAFQRDAAWIGTGNRAEVRMPHVSGQVWPGIVNAGAVSIDPNSQNIGVKLAFSAPYDKVRANQFVVGTVFGEARKDALSVPADAVIRTENEQRVVKVLGDGRFQPVKVTTGVEAGGDIEILDGLDDGDEVVVMAQFLIDSESSLKAGFRRLGGE